MKKKLHILILLMSLSNEIQPDRSIIIILYCNAVNYNTLKMTNNNIVILSRKHSCSVCQ